MVSKDTATIARSKVTRQTLVQVVQNQLHLEAEHRILLEEVEQEVVVQVVVVLRDFKAHVETVASKAIWRETVGRKKRTLD